MTRTSDVDVHCVLAATSRGRMDRSTTRTFFVPYTFRVGSTTPPLSRGSIEQLPHVSW